MLYLASQSPRRRQLLDSLGYRFEILTVSVPEEPAMDESAEHYVSRVAREKALAGLSLVRTEPEAVVLGADTEVVLDNEIFGKPRDNDEAAAMLRRLSGRVHTVISVLWVVSHERQASMTSCSQVRFAELDDAQIAAYLAVGESLDKAGAYGIQGRGAALIAHLSGSHSGVMGLPVYETVQLLTQFGLVAG